MKVAVVDPSGFTLPYDHLLCDALGRGGEDVRLYRRPSRQPDEERSGAYVPRPLFYTWAEALRGAGRGFPYRAVKALEHPFDFRTFGREAVAWGAEVVHFQWLVLPWLDRFLLKGLGPLPAVLTVHDTYPFQGSPSSRVQMLGFARSIAAFQRIVVHAQSSRDALLRWGIAPGRIAVIPHGLFPGELRGPGERKWLLHFGQLKPYKGTDLLLRAWAEVPERLRRKTPLRIAGFPAMPVGPLLRLAGELRLGATVSWDLRHVPEAEVTSLFAGARAAVIPYRSIDASGVLAQAVSHGVPVVATRVGVFGELIEDGKSGLLVPAEDAQALGLALTRLLDEPALEERLGEGMAAVRSGHPSWEAIARETREVYRAACRGTEGTR